MSLTHADYVGNDATGLADLIRRREVSTQEVLRCALDLAGALNPKINALVEIFDQPLEASPDGPFAGVPFAIKDLVCQARGTKYECGSRLGAGMKADHDTDLMRRFRGAGCRTIGRTAAPEFGFCVTTEPVFTGPVRNPWDLERMAGGSSGGSAAAIAAGIVPFAHGNDGAGSIRIPAACTGLVGLKTSRGRVPVGPDSGELLNGLAVEFALTRSVRDCAGLLDAVHGYALGDPFPLAPPPGSYAKACAASSRPLRMALMTRPWSHVEVAHISIDAAEKAARLCESLGHSVELAAPAMNYGSYLEATHTIWMTMVQGAVDAVATKSGRKVGPDTLEATTLACYYAGAATRADQLQSAFGVVNEVTRSFAKFFQDYDVLITPTLASPALPLGVLNANNPELSAQQWTETLFAFAPFTAPFNMTGQPALSLPLHRTSANLPVGVQFAARIGEEHTLLNLGARLEEAAPWPTVAPLWESAFRRR